MKRQRDRNTSIIVASNALESLNERIISQWERVNSRLVLVLTIKHSDFVLIRIFATMMLGMRRGLVEKR